MSAVRVRFAPSPTGYLHVGGARTALFNWLFARHHGGVFVLRVEDTDTQRNRSQFSQAIYDGLRWLNLDWDEGPDVGGPHGPYLQSERAPLHLAMARQLLDSGSAYECWCAALTPDENDAEDEAPPVETAPCVCRALPEERKRSLRAEKSPALRLHVDPARTLRVGDVVRGAVSFPAGTMGDFVIVTSDGRALYNLAAVADDHAMRITHVIRGEEHLANTPKQLLMYEALGWEPPVFAHIPIILNAERRKLSKRDGATSVHDYESMGYVAEALLNFLALLGWSPRDNRELLTRDDLVQLFDLDGVVKHPAIFETAKLNWMNREYLKRIPPAEIAHRVLDLIRRGDGKAQLPDFAYVERVAALLRDRVHTVLDMLELGSYFFSDATIVPTAEALTRYCSQPEAAERLRQAREALAAAPDFSPAGVEQALRGLAVFTGVKAAEFIHPLRVALTGQAVSPGIFEVCSILGPVRTLRRIDDLLARLGSYARTPEKAVQ